MTPFLEHSWKDKIIDVQNGLGLPSLEAGVVMCTREAGVATEGQSEVLWSECLCLPKMHVGILTPRDDHIRKWDIWEVLKS